MSIATNESLLKGTRGKLGNLITRSVKGKTIVSQAPDPDRPQTEAQKNNQHQFREASAFAKAATEDPGIKAYFSKVAEKRKLPNAYTAALSFKLKDLKTLARQKSQPSESNGVPVVLPAPQQPVGNLMHHEQVEKFKQLYSSMIDPLEFALVKVSTAWRNIEKMDIEKTQKEVVLTALRLEIQETLSSIHLTSKINAMEFKQPMPDFSQITPLVDKPA